MKENRPSTTAQRAALRRAAHQLLDDPKVLDDPFAPRIMGNEGESALRADPRQSETSPLSSYLRAFVAARSRRAEDELALAVRRGVDQYVIVGAGLDTFAYRTPYPQGMLHVYEVDHPATQTWKRARPRGGRHRAPRPISRLCRLTSRSSALEEGLRAIGYDQGKGAFFSWLGVTEYLTTEAVMTTLRFIASSPVESGVVFDYMISPSLLSPAQRARFEAFARRVASAGEPLQAFFEPEVLMRDLRSMGFGHVEDNGPEAINERYFKNRNDGLRVGSLSHLMVARV